MQVAPVTQQNGVLDIDGRVYLSGEGIAGYGAGGELNNGVGSAGPVGEYDGMGEITFY